MLQGSYIIPEVIPYHYEEAAFSTTIALRSRVLGTTMSQVFRRGLGS